MRHIIHTMRWLLLLLASSLPLCANAERPYCPEGKELRCLDFEHKVVERNAVCFEPMQCGEGGFVCRSELDKMTAEHKALLGRYNELANKHNEVISAYESAREGKEKIRRCISAATNLAEARSCI